MSTIKFELRYS